MKAHRPKAVERRTTTPSSESQDAARRRPSKPAKAPPAAKAKGAKNSPSDAKRSDNTPAKAAALQLLAPVAAPIPSLLSPALGALNDFLQPPFHREGGLEAAGPSTNEPNGRKEDLETSEVRAEDDPSSSSEMAVGSTAIWTAFKRGQLDVDKFGTYLAGRRGELRQPFVEKELGPFDEYIATRSLWGDKFYNQSAWSLKTKFPHHPVQIVDVASGYATRPFRLSWPSNAQYFELDQPFILEDKLHLMKQLGESPKVTHIPIPTNLKSSWEEDLKRGGFNPAHPSVWMFDGILTYLDTPAAEALLEKVSGLAASGSYLGADLLSREQFTSPAFQEPLKLLDKLGSPWRFFVDNPHAFFTQYGWLGRVFDMPRWQAQEPVLSDPLRRRSLKNQLSFLMVEARKL